MKTYMTIEPFDISICQPGTSECKTFPTFKSETMTCGDGKTVAVDNSRALTLTNFNQLTNAYEYEFKGDEQGFYCLETRDIYYASPDKSDERRSGHVWRGDSWYCPKDKHGYKGYCLKRQLPQTNCSTIYNTECQLQLPQPIQYESDNDCKILNNIGLKSQPKCISTYSDRVCEFVFDRKKNVMNCTEVYNYRNR